MGDRAIRVFRGNRMSDQYARSCLTAVSCVKKAVLRDGLSSIDYSGLRHAMAKLRSKISLSRSSIWVDAFGSMRPSKMLTQLRERRRLPNSSPFMKGAAVSTRSTARSLLPSQSTSNRVAVVRMYLNLRLSSVRS